MTADLASAQRALPLPVVALVEFVRALPYGRPSEPTVAAMLAERRGTCSLKHALLHQALASNFPQLSPQLVHRVYRIDRPLARECFSEAVARVVPEEGLVDVHRYLRLELPTGRIVIDATFPGPPWNGWSSLPLACGPGRDHIVTRDPAAEKRALEARFCDPAVREPFIAALEESFG